MSDILTAADIAELRREWIVDEIDERPEWGSGGAKASAIAAIGAASVALTGLGAGTIKRGTPFAIWSGAVPHEYAAAEDAVITANTATVSVSPLIVASVAVNDPVRCEPFRRSYYNRVHKRQMFSDVALEDLARRAEEQWGSRIHEANDPRRMRFRAIAALALKQQELDADFYSAVVQYEAQDGGTGLFNRIAALRREYENDVAQKTTGHSYGITTR